MFNQFLSWLGKLVGSGFVIGLLVILYQNWIQKWFDIRFSPDILSYKLVDTSKGYVVFSSTRTGANPNHELYQFLEYQIIPVTDLKNIKAGFTFDNEVVVMKESLTCNISTPECINAKIENEGYKHYRLAEIEKLTRTNRAIVTFMIKKPVNKRSDAIFKEPSISIEKERINESQ